MKIFERLKAWIKSYSDYNKAPTGMPPIGIPMPPPSDTSVLVEEWERLAHEFRSLRKQIEEINNGGEKVNEKQDSPEPLTQVQRDVASQEMDLESWVNILPPSHCARKEFESMAAIQEENAELKLQIKGVEFNYDYSRSLNDDLKTDCAKLQDRIQDAVNIYAGMDGGNPDSSMEKYLLRIVDKMNSALTGDE